MKKILICLILACCVFGNDLETIISSKKVRIGLRTNQAPFSVLREDGKFEGFEVEFAKKIGKALVGEDGEIEFIAVEADNRIEFLKENKADLMIANLSINDKRRKQITFSYPYLSNDESVVSKKSANIKNINDLLDKKVLVVPNTTSYEIAQKNGLSNFVFCKNTKECFLKLQNNEAVAYLHTNILISYLTILDESLEMSIPMVGDASFIGVGATLENKKLINFVNDEILRLSKEGFFKDAYKSILEPFYRGTLDKKFLLLDDLYLVYMR